jgi:hypothetical protein
MMQATPCKRRVCLPSCRAGLAVGCTAARQPTAHKDCAAQEHERCTTNLDSTVSSFTSATTLPNAALKLASAPLGAVPGSAFPEAAACLPAGAASFQPDAAEVLAAPPFGFPAALHTTHLQLARTHGTRQRWQAQTYMYVCWNRCCNLVPPLPRGRRLLNGRK